MKYSALRLQLIDDEKQTIVDGLISEVIVEDIGVGMPGDPQFLTITAYPGRRRVIKWMPEIRKWQYQGHHYRRLEIWAPEGEQ
jgi:hypothetical protein